MENLITPVKRIALVAKLFYSHNIKKICNRSVEAKLMEENKIEIFSRREEAKKRSNLSLFPHFLFKWNGANFRGLKWVRKLDLLRKKRKCYCCEICQKEIVFHHGTARTTHRMGRGNACPIVTFWQPKIWRTSPLLKRMIGIRAAASRKCNFIFYTSKVPFPTWAFTLLYSYHPRSRHQFTRQNFGKLKISPFVCQAICILQSLHSFWVVVDSECTRMYMRVVVIKR